MSFVDWSVFRISVVNFADNDLIYIARVSDKIPMKRKSRTFITFQKRCGVFDTYHYLHATL